MANEVSKTDQWRIFKDASSIEWIKNADNESIAYLGGFASDKERALMVAAPELLERLEWAHAQLCQHPDWCEANHPTLTAEHNAIRAAIAKAKGETS